MSQDVSFMSQAEKDQRNIIKRLEERRKASICPIVQETLDQQLENEAAELDDLLRFLANMPQPSDTNGTST